jgi:hypothetical protein
VILAANWKKQARALKDDFHFGYSSAIEGISYHLTFPSSDQILRAQTFPCLSGSYHRQREPPVASAGNISAGEG